jgi:hypothetical protein
MYIMYINIDQTIAGKRIMAHRKTRNVQNTSAITKKIDVTNLTSEQKHDLFIINLTQAGFTGFTKKKVGEQTYYTVTYKS